MAFVPIVPREEPPSPRARDLGNRLAEVIETFQRQYPGTSPEDIRRAMRLAVPRGGQLDQRKAAMLAALLALGLGLFLALATNGGRWESRGVPVVAIVLAAVAVLGGVLARRLRS